MRTVEPEVVGRHTQGDPGGRLLRLLTEARLDLVAQVALLLVWKQL